MKSSKVTITDDFHCAGIIDRTIPKHPLIFKPDPYLLAEEIISAIEYAKDKHGCENLYAILKWARKVIYDKK